MIGSGANSSWVRTRDERSAKLFMAERKMQAEVRADRARRSREFRRDLWRRVRGLFSRNSS